MQDRTEKEGQPWDGVRAKGQRKRPLESLRRETRPPAPPASPSPSQCGVVLIATPATLVALQTLVAGQKAIAAPAPGLGVHTAERQVCGISEPDPLSWLRPPSHQHHTQDLTCRPSHGSPHVGTGPGRRRRGSRCGWTGTRHTGWSWPGSPRRSDA